MSLLGDAYSATAGLPFDADELEARLVWIWGSPRSGSTWLLQQLCHPLEPVVGAPAGVRAPGGAAAPHGGFDALPVDETFISNHLAPALGDPFEAGGRLVPDTPNGRFEGSPGYVFSQSFADVWGPELRRLALLRLHSQAARAAREGIPVADAALFVIKEVNGSHAADRVMSLLPRARMLFLVRDGRDVVDSLLAAYAPGGFLARNQGYALESAEERRRGLEWASRLWACNVDATLAALDRHRPELSRVVRYEDLRADAQATLAPLFKWLGLERDPGWLAAMVAARSFGALPAHKRGPGSRQRSASPGLWRERLTAAEQRTAMEIMGPRLERLGYQPDGTRG